MLTTETLEFAILVFLGLAFTFTCGVVADNHQDYTRALKILQKNPYSRVGRHGIGLFAIVMHMPKGIRAKRVRNVLETLEKKGFVEILTHRGETRFKITPAGVMDLNKQEWSQCDDNE